MSEIDLVNIAVNQGFAIAVAIYLLYDKSKTQNQVIETIKENTKTQTELKAAIQRLCDQEKIK